MTELRALAAVACLVGTVDSLLAACIGPPKAPAAPLPGDQDKQHSVVIDRSGHAYSVQMDSPVDGVMTRDPIGYAACRQGWQPNRFARLENVGRTDVVNPWLVVNGKRQWRSLQEIADQAVKGWTTDADKARAVWEFTRHHRFHATTWDHECNDAVKVFNVYGYTLCGNDAQVISDLWKAAGLKTRRGYPTGHCVAEVFYDGAYHLLDGDEHCLFLRRDNRTIASEAEVVDDHDLVKRTHTYGILRGDDRRTDEFSASLYIYEGERKGQHGGRSKHTMAYVLRPGESIEWRWDHVGKQYSKGTDLKGAKWKKDGQGDLRAWGRTAYSRLCNGKMVYEPDLTGALARQGLDSSLNLSEQTPGLRAKTAGRPCHAVWRIQSPYVVVGAKLDVTCRREADDASAAVSLSQDGKKWTAEKVGEQRQTLVLDEHLSPRGRPQYGYLVRLELRGAAVLDAIRFETDLQMAPLSLPELESGVNTVRYEDETKGERRVCVTHAWTQRTAWRRPGRPELVTPGHGAVVVGTKVELAWRPAVDPDGDAIADYQIQVSEHADMRWVLSPNFDRLLSRTSRRGLLKAAEKPSTPHVLRWRVPYVGLLNPGQTYYWRVRARDAKQVWGPWSDVRSFSCDAPGVPVDVKATADADTGAVVLTWAANRSGARPVSFKVYASNERGFTPSDKPYLVRMGRGFCRNLKEYEAKGAVNEYVKTPANLAATTKERRLLVAGPRAQGPNANKAFYRVVAVDARGLESGGSDMAKAPRPFVCTRPTTRGVAGKPWAYAPQSLASIGDLRCKRGYKRAFWNREELKWSLVEAPDWLSIDAATGRITGVPPASAVGEHRVTVRVASSNGKSAEQTFTLHVAGAQ